VPFLSRRKPTGQYLAGLCVCVLSCVSAAAEAFLKVVYVDAGSIQNACLAVIARHQTGHATITATITATIGSTPPPPPLSCSSYHHHHHQHHHHSILFVDTLASLTGECRLRMDFSVLDRCDRQSIFQRRA
jgi:hypothetical protein